jgi:hypothetical protein
MKLDGEWISTWAARAGDAEDGITAGGVFTHRAHRMNPGMLASTSENVRVEAREDVMGPLKQMGYKSFSPIAPPQVGSADSHA